MTVFQALVMGVIQGLGEFLPISSSAHLVLAPWVFGWDAPGLSFDVALHMGTLVAVVAYFWRDWVELFSEAIIKRRSTKKASLFWYLLIATIPGALAGYILEEQAATVFRDPLLIATMLIIMGLILFLVDRRAANRKEITSISFSDSLLIGLSQAFAIIPGVSRSGVTMTAGRALGLTRETAARFSFLLSTPIIFGAGVMQLKDIAAAGINLAFITGVVTSAVVGFLAIGFLLKYLTQRSFAIFAWYRFLIGFAVIVLFYVRMP
ncbi:MAG: undecaprenyl-diphosphate phosphatase [Desulfotomaculaceae bacterium]|nr:undecaprenyl-diphosphate phosphatase [Desulfotomaculaceae bacterium]MDD4765972.1 undecaprenyl-diphosphate phosphatase [Desulfotomaculaceae bacterium]